MRFLVANPSSPAVILTEEQSRIVHYTGNRLIVSAYAGTGKTATLVHYAQSHPSQRMLYLAYNRAIRDEAAGNFPRNVICKTAHQLAYAVYGALYRQKLQFPLRLTHIAEALNSENWFLIKAVYDTLQQYLWSPELDIMPCHLPVSLPRTEMLAATRNAALTGAELIWLKMRDRQDRFPTTHDAYLKEYQLSQPNLSLNYDVVLFDEAQDANPVITDIVLKQPGTLLFVGDPHQQIYRWRGAADALSNPQLEKVPTYYLSRSFRFGPEIAAIANAILQLKGEKRSLLGGGQPGSVLQTAPKKSKKTVLHRTVMGVLQTALKATEQRKMVLWVGGINGYQLSDLEDLHYLSRTQYECIKNKQLLHHFKTYSRYCCVAEESEDTEMRRAIAIIEKYPDLPKKLTQLRNNSSDDPNEVEITVSTVHRSKGLEWPLVELYEDFLDALDQKKEPALRVDELNLLYVAVTRASETLVINQTILDILEQPPSKDLYP